jgi:hypothetical protein
MKILQSYLLKSCLYTPSVVAAFLLISSLANAQELMTIKHSCNFEGEETETEIYVDDASAEAKNIVAKIMRINSLQQNFKVKSASCKNALATSEGNERFILYSTSFLENFKKGAKTEWAAYCVLAHEIGHHLNFHNLSETDSKKRKIYELQSDKFAGGVLYRLGATLEQAQAGINTFGLEGETTTHPSRRARLEAVAQGWKQSQELTPRADDNAPIVDTKNVNNSETRKNENAKDNSSMMPPYVPDKTNDSKAKPTYTEVSDNILAQKVVGKWYTNGINANGSYETLVFIYANGQFEAAYSNNYVISGGSVGTWYIKNGVYHETVTMFNFQTVNIFSKLSVKFLNDNAISLTVLETTLPQAAPVGTIINFTRRY